MKQRYDRVKLRRAFWYGPEPVAGDALRTPTGRQYLIMGVNGKTLDCMVDEPGAPVGGTVFDWEWSRRDA